MIDITPLKRMRCPRCTAPLRQNDTVFSCERGHLIRWRDGYLDATDPLPNAAADRTVQSFGYEWTTFDVINPEDQRFWQTYFADLPLDRLRGRSGLDAGCGKGRYSYFTAAHVETLVALDASDAVVVAARNLAGLRNTVVVKADLRDAPFLDETFGFISCLGVLHHLSDPIVGFRELVRLLMPGGILLIYVYSRPRTWGVRAATLAAARALRRATVRWPYPLLRAMCAAVACLLYVGFVLPGMAGDRLGIRHLYQLPLSGYRLKPLRSLWLDTFDRLSAPIERRFLWEEVQGWFDDAGLQVEHVRDEAGLFILATKPERPDRAGHL
jgi:SAM-dependent methyltransferase